MAFDPAGDAKWVAISFRLAKERNEWGTLGRGGAYKKQRCGPGQFPVEFLSSPLEAMFQRKYLITFQI